MMNTQFCIGILPGLHKLPTLSFQRKIHSIRNREIAKICKKESELNSKPEKPSTLFYSWDKYRAHPEMASQQSDFVQS
jgi:hypothetical protein